MEGNVMKKIAVAAASLFVLSGVAACGESAADKAAEKNATPAPAPVSTTARNDKAQADAAPTDAQKDALNHQADQVEDNADRRADKIEQQGGNADGGMTTHNTPTTN